MQHCAGRPLALLCTQSLHRSGVGASARVTPLLREAAAAGGVDDPASVICACVDHLYGAARFRVAQADVEQASPYRTYMHNVLAQRQGTKEAVAAVLLSVLARAEARIGRPLEYRLEIPAEAAGRPLDDDRARACRRRRRRAKPFPPAHALLGHHRRCT